MAVYVGLDCGGSSTRVLAINEAGEPLFRGQSGPANLLSTPPEMLRSNLEAATRGCPPPDAACGCFAGLVDDQVRSSALEMLQDIFPRPAALRAEPDYAAALTACGPDTAACVIAGTGSVVCSRVNGELVKTGGRGPILGDAGSAAQIGSRGLSLYLDDRSSFSIRFPDEIHSLLGATDERQVVRRVYSSPSPAALLARLAAPIVQESKSHSGLQEIVREEMSGLATLVLRHLKAHGISSGRVGLAGGLWKIDPLLREHFEGSLRGHSSLPLFILRKAPVEGAAQLAREALN